MKHNLFVVTLVLIFSLVLGACAPQSGNSTGPGSTTSAAGVSVDSVVPAIADAEDLVGVTVLQDGLGLDSGGVAVIGLLETMRYMQQVWMEAPGTFVMEGPNGQYMVAWAMRGSSWGFLGLNTNGTPITDLAKFVGANKTGSLSFAGLVKDLEANGWNYISPRELPAWFGVAIETSSAFIIHFGTYMADFAPMIFVVTPAVEQMFELQLRPVPIVE